MSRAKSWRGVRIYTIGHSTRTLDELVALLRTFGVSLLADIRTIPDRATILSSTPTLFAFLSGGDVFAMRIFHDSGACAALARHHRTRDGATPASAGSPTT